MLGFPLPTRKYFDCASLLCSINKYSLHLATSVCPTIVNSRCTRLAKIQQLLNNTALHLAALVSSSTIQHLICKPLPGPSDLSCVASVHLTLGHGMANSTNKKIIFRRNIKLNVYLKNVRAGLKKHVFLSRFCGYAFYHPPTPIHVGGFYNNILKFKYYPHQSSALRKADGER